MGQRKLRNSGKVQYNLIPGINTELFGTITGKKICVLGFSFKANTNDTRESAAIHICKDLLEEGAKLIIHDPKVDSKQISKDLNINCLQKNFNENYENLESSCEYKENIVEAAEGADAIVVLTEWSEYSEINWNEVASRMRKPSWVFDSRSILVAKNVLESGLNFWRIGDGS